MACESWLRLGDLEWCQTIGGPRKIHRVQPWLVPAASSPRSNFDLLMAVIAVCLAPAVHPIAADIILTALAVWAMRNSQTAPGPSERKPGRAFTYHHAALGQSETYPGSPANP